MNSVKASLMDHAARARLRELGCQDSPQRQSWRSLMREALDQATEQSDAEATACLLILSLAGDIEGGPDACLRALESTAIKLGFPPPTA